MNVLHHPVKVCAAFGLEREGLEKQIHQERLTTTNTAPDVEARHDFAGSAEQSKQSAT